MAESSIEWTDATWNPTVGCTKVSAGCKHCYAEVMHARLTKMGQAKYADPFTTVKPYPEHLSLPLSWKKPRRVFVNSMSDLFHDDVPDEYIAAVFGVMAATKHHTYQVLTKRADRMARWFAWAATQPILDWHGSPLPSMETSHPWYICSFAAERHGALVRGRQPPPYPWPLPNVWLGVSAENQEMADERIPHLLSTPAAVRFVSYEPALGHLDLDLVPRLPGPCAPSASGRGIAWVIVGGESGHGARPFDIAWARSVVKQCKAAGVACFVKQLGADPRYLVGDCQVPMRSTGEVRSKKGGDMAEWPEDLRVREFPLSHLSQKIASKQDETTTTG